MSVVDLAGPSGNSRLLIMRHPETTANEQGRYLGSGEAPLSSRGEAQRLRAVEALAALAPDRIVSSPLSRCLDLSRMVGAHLGLEPEVDHRVREINFGELEGLTFSEAKARGMSFLWNVPEATRPAPGGELFVDFNTRLDAAREDLAALPGTTAVIAHGGVIRHLLMGWFGFPLDMIWNLRVENVSTAVVGFVDGTPILEKFGLTPEDVARLA